MDNNQTNYSLVTCTPGKCLLSGGYLILNQNKMGIVLNVDAYFKVESIIKTQSLSSSSQLGIIVKSLHLNEQYDYVIECNDKTILYLYQINKDCSNKWIENSIKVAIFTFLAMNHQVIDFNDLVKIFTNKTIHITIDSDYRYYSYDKTNTSKDLKTGLGSSSALIVSLCSNIILLLENSLKEKSMTSSLNKSVKDIDLKLQGMISLASILSNNISQNKIGSGFDIMSCLFGNLIFKQCTLIYPDISNYCLNNEIIETMNQFMKRYTEEYISKMNLLKNIGNEYQSSLISIEHGSDTRLFVKNVLKWAEEHKIKELFDDELFSQLDKINNEVIQALSNKNDKGFDYIKELCMKYRGVLQEITNSTKVDIEPLILTPLLDNLIKASSVIYAICPGAGGYDSIVVLGKGNDSSLFRAEILKYITEFNNSFKNKEHQAYAIPANIINNGTQFSYCLLS